MTTVYLNGEYLPHDRALISPDDRGFIFGDGIYEVVRVIEGRIFEWDAHAERMTRGLAALRIAFGARDVAGLRGVSERLVRDNGLADGEATVYLQVSRGAAPRTHHFPAAGTGPTVYAFAAKFVVPREQREMGVKAITHPDVRWARCDLKTVNLLGAVLARQAASEAGAYEAILLRDGVVTEGAATNAFAVVGGTLRTYPLSNYILPGITRKVLFEIAAELGIAIVEEPVTHLELPKAEELFLCGTTTDVNPVVLLDGRPVGNGKPGPVTRRLQDALAARMYAAVGAAR
jgi:D-alanine transaminase